MARKCTPGSIAVSSNSSGTPVVKGTATLGGRRLRRTPTFPSLSAALAMPEALAIAVTEDPGKEPILSVVLRTLSD